MDDKYMQAAYQTLKDSGQFNDAQSQAIARAIQAAFGQFGFSVQWTPPSVVPAHQHKIEETNGHTHKLSS
ncbi:MAG TPA: hypothetical protein VLZ89_16450 [Anaerolineales bacterium]|nr:hypothetical protein [Anaerolineales bacterium]